SCCCSPLALRSFPTRRSSDLLAAVGHHRFGLELRDEIGIVRDLRQIAFRLRKHLAPRARLFRGIVHRLAEIPVAGGVPDDGRLRSEEHTSELQSRENLVCRLL